MFAKKGYAECRAPDQLTAVHKEIKIHTTKLQSKWPCDSMIVNTYNGFVVLHGDELLEDNGYIPKETCELPRQRMAAEKDGIHDQRYRNS